MDWVKAYAVRMSGSPDWWPELLSLYWECVNEVPDVFIQWMAKRQAASFWLIAAQAKILGWWDPPPSLSALHRDAFLPPGGLQGLWDIWETRKENTLALAKALQSCCKWSGWPYNMMCRVTQDLQRCMGDLMQFGEEDILEIPLLEPADDMPIASSLSGTMV